MRSKGQSLIELILMLPVFIAFWAAMTWFAQALIISIELLHTARYGVFRLAYQTQPASKRIQAETVRRECLDYLQNAAPQLRGSRIPVDVQVEPGDTWRAVGPESLKDVLQLISFTDNMEKEAKNSAGLVNFRPASVRVECALPAPRLLRAIPGFPAQLPLRGYCACYR